jgi:hypothetical protein
MAEDSLVLELQQLAQSGSTGLSELLPGVAPSRSDSQARIAKRVGRARSRCAIAYAGRGERTPAVCEHALADVTPRNHYRTRPARTQNREARAGRVIEHRAVGPSPS